MGQIYRGFPTGRLTTEADRARLDGLGLRLILDLRSGAEAAKLPDYVPDGARLVQICGLRDATGQEIDFLPTTSSGWCRAPLPGRTSPS